jgi:gamma-glutamylcyclotransferase (GGCT)/AIG2-like uncharacterized protein YtfP
MTGVIPARLLVNDLTWPLPGEPECDLLFVYGILKRGFSLDLSKYGGEFLGEAELHEANIYSIGGGVGLRFALNNHDTVHGEVFRIPKRLWGWLDDIEGNPYHYKREVVHVHMDYVRGDNEKAAEEMLLEPVKAWVYVHQYPHENNPKRLIKSGRYE